MKKSTSDLIAGLYPRLLEELTVPAEIRQQGLCGKVDPELFYSENIAEINQAKAICEGCPVRDLCLDYSTQAEEWGVWGGHTPAQRKKLRGSLPLVPIEERQFALKVRRDVASPELTVAEVAKRYSVTPRTVARWKVAILRNKAS